MRSIGLNNTPFRTTPPPRSNVPAVQPLRSVERFERRLWLAYLFEPLPALRSDPDLAAFVDFFFPDRHGSLDLLDRKTAGRESGVAMRR